MNVSACGVTRRAGLHMACEAGVVSDNAGDMLQMELGLAYLPGFQAPLSMPVTRLFTASRMARSRTLPFSVES